MIRRILFGGIVVLIFAGAVGCAGQPSPGTEAAAPTAAQTAGQTAGQTTAPSLPASGLPAFDAGPFPNDHGDVMNGSGSCVICHKNMVDEAGVDVSTDKLWAASMMANAARDPYWQATVQSEVQINPALKEVLEDKCATCHMPAAYFTDVVAGGKPAVVEKGYLSKDNPQHALAMDGVTCTACHQIKADNFGQPESFSGGYVIDKDLPKGQRAIYGPFPIDQNTVSLMMAASGFFPAQSDHLQQSEMCATCHTLYTSYLDAQGEVAGEFPEQTSYLEWQASQYADKQSCQSCHMPEASGKVAISTTGTAPRSPVRAHSFLGGNNTVLMMFRSSGEKEPLPASSADLDAAIQRNLEFMQTQAATVAIQEAQLSGQNLEAVIAVTNTAGHKFPTSFPSRRAWLHVTVKDSAGAVIWESGAVEPNGLIQGNDNDADADKFEPHYAEVTSPDQVQIYESIMGTAENRMTTTLLFGAQYFKDNRLLPAGFDAQKGGKDVAPYGITPDDVDFAAGGDQLKYTMDLGQAQGPFTVTVEVLYQSIGYRWAENLRAEQGDLIRVFADSCDAQPNAPIVVATASREVK